MKLYDTIKYLNPLTSPVKRGIAISKYLYKSGSNLQVFHKVSFGSEPYLISLGNNVKITYGCKFITHEGGIHVLRTLKDEPDIHLYGTIMISDNVFIGNDVIILPGIKIGKNCIIGAGSVVTASIPDNSVAAGVPARVISSIDNYYDKVKNRLSATSKLTSKAKEEFLRKMLYASSTNGLESDE